MAVPSPEHVAIVMDGNRRWARQQGLSPLSGHQRGAEVLKEIVQACPELGIPYLTVYAFSSENWNRPEDEVSGLMDLLEQYLRAEVQAIHEARVRLRVIGNRKALSGSIQALIHDAEQLTRHNQRLFLQVALSYGSRDEMVRAMMAIGEQIKSNTLSPHDITEAVLAQNLDTAGMPDPSLLIRTSGEYRLSNYLLWQLAYAELLFVDKFWPDFLPQDLECAVRTYQARKRRFGRAA